MRERRDAARLVNTRNHFFRATRRCAATNAGRPATSQRSKASPDRSRRARPATSASRDPGPARGTSSESSIAGRRICVGIEGDAERGQRVDHLADAIDALPTLLGQKRQQGLATSMSMK